MTIATTNVAPSVDTFQTLIDKVNLLAYVLSTQLITANSTANGSLTTGNAFVNGIFSSDTLAVQTSLRGGNVQNSNTLVIDSNVSISNMLLVGGEYTTSNTSTQVIDSFYSNTFSTAKYVLQVNSAAGLQSSEVLLMQNGANSYLTEYSILTTNGSLGVFSSNISANSTQLLFTPINSVNNIKFERITIPV